MTRGTLNSIVLFPILAMLIGGCAQQVAKPVAVELPPQPVLAQPGNRATALCFDPAISRDLPEPDVARDGREPQVVLGYEQPSVSYADVYTWDRLVNGVDMMFREAYLEDVKSFSR